MLRKADIIKPTSIERKKAAAGQLSPAELPKKLADVFYATKAEADAQKESVWNKNVSPGKAARPTLSQSRKQQSQKAATAAVNSNNSFNSNARALQTMGDVFSSKGTTYEKTTTNQNVMQLYSQLSALLLKKEGMLDLQARSPKAKKMNKSLSKSNMNLNATQFSESKRTAVSPNNALLDFQATLGSLSPATTSKHKLKKPDLNTFGKSNSSH